MRTFALKQKPTQKEDSAGSTRHSRAFSGQSRKVRSILHRLKVQPKLTLGSPGDFYEEEADRTANRIMQVHDSPVQRPKVPEKEVEIQPKNSSGQAPEMTRHIESRINPPQSAGQAMPGSERLFFEPRFGFDFSDVRVHSNEPDADAAQSIQARAFTWGRNIVFGSGQYSPGTPGGRRLMAHELTHVVQQSGGLKGRGVSALTARNSRHSAVIQRKVSSRYGKIEDNLTYGIFDWAITDAEAREVLEILQKEKDPRTFEDTLAEMEKEGLLERLLDNISDEDQKTYGTLISTIKETRKSAQVVSAKIEYLMSYDIFDWAITDAEAKQVLDALKALQPQAYKLNETLVSLPQKYLNRFFENLSGEHKKADDSFLSTLRILAKQEAQKILKDLLDLKGSPEELRDELVAMPKRKYENFWEYLPEDEVQRNVRFFQEMEMIRQTGMTFEEMGAKQREFMQAEADIHAVEKEPEEKEEKKKEKPDVKKEEKPEEKKEGEPKAKPKGSISKLIKKRSEELGYKLKESPKATEEQNKKLEQAIDKIEREAPEDIKKMLKEAKDKGMTFRYDALEFKKGGAAAGAFSRYTKTFKVNMPWINAALKDPSSVYSNIAHELGHWDYGDTLAKKIFRHMFAGMPPEERRKIATGSISSTYYYPETEIFAELREYPYVTSSSLGDRPEASGVVKELKKIKKLYEPSIAKAIVMGLRRRVQLDNTIAKEAKEMFDCKVASVFDLDL
jgi:hypothetical protein